MSELFTIRHAEPGDCATLTAYSSLEGMGPIEPGDTVRVAVSDDGDIVGFIRLVFDSAGVCHINPVVVYSTWRGFGVGRALVEGALGEFGELRLVSRGTSRAFYEALGFEAIPWDDIHPPIVEECDECELFDECSPLPMRKKAPCI
ncbi:GNAT family N-acetyltransferase [Raoultibacter phocaeensis]|uniref:GNAT family N-acetyltransferase n=1 Tax=Raoultibacter phocaeensis TaxID=2479841 RepID=UPI00111A71D5|nr:GNAT family N-acetyltransferase [Raoultibacter phocaeensis]